MHRFAKEAIVSKAKSMGVGTAAETYGIPKSAISRWIGEVPVRREYHKWTEEDWRVASVMWAKGRSYSEIAEVVGTTADSVSTMVKHHRDLFPKRSPGWRRRIG